MKITTNSFGNYSLNRINQNQQIHKAAQADKKPEITNAEKKFFANLYPEKTDEILKYEFYNAKGKVSGVTVGSLFDKRG
ncbi:hypothetical protein MROS_2127 [Melioribacter roseus P3M-2]|jgi:hypothetical protein|uniref:Uncharacterized protein n=1 Tax=Melioribacter roseus (strain DSM 23840 / JCM 17771 / VKM B-2668 / P3M-2) TaxID=1191523 RepID=I6YXR5_MELRP|nr:hypothetical protein [Melioribacter roseus]AFN75357.1 hypothetical protein MROS_2127 [Melioribacter roseus P3M-2]